MRQTSMQASIFIVGFIALSNLFNASAAAQDLLVADFESERYESWIATGDCFGTGPAAGTLPGQMQVDGYLGKRLVNSFLKGDGATGTLTSTEFKIERHYLAFLIGGGNNPDKLALQLLVDGRVVQSSTGPNSQPGGSETLMQDAWDVAEFQGKSAVLRVIDDARGGWGHINVDHIVQTDKKPSRLLSEASRDFAVQSKYLLLPIRNGAAKRVVSLEVEGKHIVRNDIELADGPADWWAPMNVSPWQGKKVTVRVDKLPEESHALKNVQQQDELPQVEALYGEPLRGQFHFSPQRGWNNDPNGLVYFNSEYHLFFQHNPYGWGWGNMHWGHAVSPDLVHWRELGDVLLPDELGPMFSGSAVVDWNNSSGFGRGGKVPLVLIYTAAGKPTVQCLAYSLDGRTFTKYDGNPVLPQITGGNRDPKVFWHEPTKKWVMVLYVELDKRHTVQFFTSDNMKDWTKTSSTIGEAPGKPYLYECPDFFELSIDNQPSQKKWVLTAANSAYAIGTFDGARFNPEQSNLTGHQGKGFYAAQTFSDIPNADGRRIQIGWFQTETRGMPFNQSMTVPLELRLVSTSDGPRMTMTPVKELEQLRLAHQHFDKLTVNPGAATQLGTYELAELRTEWQAAAAASITFNVRGVAVQYLGDTQQLKVGDRLASAPLRGGKQTLTIYCDRTGLEIFASDGLCYVPWPKNLRPEDQQLTVAVEGVPVTFTQLDVYQLRSAWK